MRRGLVTVAVLLCGCGEALKPTAVVVNLTDPGERCVRVELEGPQELTRKVDTVLRTLRLSDGAGESLAYTAEPIEERAYVGSEDQVFCASSAFVRVEATFNDWGVPLLPGVGVEREGDVFSR
ncbi:MAG: hypothetical protein ACO1OB_11360 [Archangium sp.]